MTHNEIIVMTVCICMGVIVLSALFQGGWKAILLEILCSAAVIASVYYFEMPTESILKKRYKERVLEKHKECFEKCTQLCITTELKD